MNDSEFPLRCKRCRTALVQFIRTDGDVQRNVISCCESSRQIFPLEESRYLFSTSLQTAEDPEADDSNNSACCGYPRWIVSCLNQGEWCRGKLLCPGCGAKVGAFSFIGTAKCSCGGSTLPCVYLIRQKVDFPERSAHSFLKVDQWSQSSQNNGRRFSILDRISNEDWNISFYKNEHMQMTKMSDFRGKSHKKCHSWHGNVCNTITSIFGTIFSVKSESALFSDSASNAEHTTSSTSLKSSQTGASQLNEHSEPEDKKLRKQKAGPNTIKIQPETKEGEEELPELLRCCVCLQLFCKPRSCNPCSHVFCEPCLRSLVHWQAATVIKCPLCRTTIFCTVPNKELESMIQLEHPIWYRKRLDWFSGQRKLLRSPLPTIPFFFQRRFGHHLRRLVAGASPGYSAICLTVLCTIFFFLLFIPGVYITSSLYDHLHSLNFDNLTHVEWAYIYPQDIWLGFVEWAFSAVGSSLLISVSLAAASALVLYAIFMM